MSNPILDAMQGGGGGSGYKAPPWKPSPLPFDAFMLADYRHTWRIRKVLVANEPAVVFGPSKILKTSTIVDACICLAAGQPFLGAFEVVNPARVFLVSGESGPATLQAIAERVCESRQIMPETVASKLMIECSVPPLSDSATLQTLRELLDQHQSEILVVDPTYLTLLGGPNGGAEKAPSMFAMGDAIGQLVATCRLTGAQLVLVHHTNSSLKIGDEPGLEHIAYAGFAQFCRQWIGLNRREKYQFDGKHELEMVAGGSAGHGGKWHLSIDEGRLDDDFTGRRWEVQVVPAFQGEARAKAEKASTRDAKKAADFEAELASVYQAIVRLAPATMYSIRGEARIGDEKAKVYVQKLLNDKRVREVEVKVKSGKGGEQLCAAYSPIVDGKLPMD